MTNPNLPKLPKGAPTKPWASRLCPFEDEIRTLRRAQKTYQEIADALAEAQRNERVPTLEELARASLQRIEETEAMLEAMRAEGWVAETDGGEWVMVGGGASLDAGRIFRRFVLPLAELEALSREADGRGNAALRDVLERLRQAFDGKAQIG